LARASEFDQLDLGFSVFYLNRCNRSGILSGGLIGGLKQKGKWKMGARFPRKELVRRIEAIAAKRDFITVKNLDAEKYILKHLPMVSETALVYCDPPYYHKSKRLPLGYFLFPRWGMSVSAFVRLPPSLHFGATSCVETRRGLNQVFRRWCEHRHQSCR